MNKPAMGKPRKLVKKSNKFKRLYFDIETSPNIVFSWNIGYKLNLMHDSIIKERRIICICYKWEHENKVHSLTWNKGDDKEMLIKFVAVMNIADECIGHNSDQYDLKWVRTRAMFHDISVFPDYTTVDTLKLSRRGFRFNSNKLDYIGQFLGLGKKKDTGGFGLWKDIVLNNSRESLKKMVDYCIGDVLLLEKIFNRLNPYVKHKTHVGVLEGGDKCNCPNCGSDRLQKRGISVSAVGYKKQRLQCQICGKYFSLSFKSLEKDVLNKE